MLIVAAGRPWGDALAGHLSGRRARVLLCDPAEPDLEAAAELDPEVVLIEPTAMAREGLAIARALHSHRTLRWASILRCPWSRFWEPGAAEPDLLKLGRLLAPLLEQERTLRGRARREESFVTELDRVGPSRTLRILAETGGVYRIVAHSPEARVQLDVAEGRVLRAEARLPPRSILGEAALELYYGLRSGPVAVHRMSDERDPQAEVATAPWTPPSHLVSAAAEPGPEDQRTTRKLRPLRVQWTGEEGDSTPRIGSLGVPSSAFVLPDLFDADMVDTLREDDGLTAPRRPHGAFAGRGEERQGQPLPEAPAVRIVPTPLPPSPPEEAGAQVPVLLPAVARPGPSRTSPPAAFPVVAEDQAARVTGAAPSTPRPWVLVGGGTALILLSGLAVALAVAALSPPSAAPAAAPASPSSPLVAPTPRAPPAPPAVAGSPAASTALAAPRPVARQTALAPPEAIPATAPVRVARSASAVPDASSDPTGHARALVREARRLPLPGSAARAEALYRRALELRPHDPRAMAGLAEVFLRAGERQEAVTWAERAVHAAPRRASYRVLWGDALERQGRTEEAHAQWREGLRRSPHNRAIRHRLGRRAH